MKSSETYAVDNTVNSTAKKRLTLAVILAVPLFVTSGVSNNFDNTHCTASAQASCIAKIDTGNSANSSWLNWLSGGSRSTQFQFIDLFELVHSPKYQPTKTVVPTREG